jgi:hypothetical protein
MSSHVYLPTKVLFGIIFADTESSRLHCLRYDRHANLPRYLAFKHSEMQTEAAEPGSVLSMVGTRVLSGTLV